MIKHAASDVFSFVHLVCNGCCQQISQPLRVCKHHVLQLLCVVVEHAFAHYKLLERQLGLTDICNDASTDGARYLSILNHRLARDPEAPHRLQVQHHSAMYGLPTPPNVLPGDDLDRKPHVRGSLKRLFTKNTQPDPQD